MSIPVLPATLRSKWLAAPLVLIALTALVSGCGSSSSSSGGGGEKLQGGTATMALPPGEPPTYIFPLLPVEYQTYVNIAYFQYLMYRPLYSFGKDEKPVLDPELSLADEPVFSNHNRTVTIKLKPYRWSDGQPLTSRDVTFWMNMLKANREHWAPYVEGYFPDNVEKVVADNPHELTFTLNKSYSSRWFTYNQLSQITPMPQHVWDKTSTNGKVGNYDETESGAQAVYKFLDEQSKSLNTYATNPLWQVVDGPFQIEGFTPEGLATFKPNAKYSGPIKPTISKFVLKPFTSDSAEFNVLLSSHEVNYGYVPIDQSDQAPRTEGQGYTIKPWVGWGINFIALNHNNPTAGPIFNQAYVRQAMQRLVDQESYVESALHGNGYPTYGPVPIKPDNPFVSEEVESNPLKYDPSAALESLKSHGWDVQPNGVTTCAKPGSGPGHCGPGVGAGAKMEFELQYWSGLAYLTTEMEALKSSFSSAGIDVNLRQVPIANLYGNLVPCEPHEAACSWQMGESGGWGFGPDYYPAGDIFATGSGTNFGSYSDPANDKNIEANHTALTEAEAEEAMERFQNYLAKQAPDIWMPKPYYQLSAISNNLQGVEQRPMTFITPEQWYFTK